MKVANKNKRKRTKLTNRIKSETQKAGASTRLLAIFLDVKYTTVSKWNGNTTQPTRGNADAIGELLEKDYRDLWEPQGSSVTGLAKAANAELERLNKEKKIPYVIDSIDKETGEKVKVNNPVLVKAIRDFVAKYKKGHKSRAD